MSNEEVTTVPSNILELIDLYPDKPWDWDKINTLASISDIITYSHFPWDYSKITISHI